MNNYDKDNTFTRVPSTYSDKIGLIDPYSFQILVFLLSKSFYRNNHYSEVEISTYQIENACLISRNKVIKSLRFLSENGYITIKKSTTKKQIINFITSASEALAKKTSTPEALELARPGTKLVLDKHQTSTPEALAPISKAAAEEPNREPIDLNRYIDKKEREDLTFLLFEDFEEMQEFFSNDRIKKLNKLMEKTMKQNPAQIESISKNTTTVELVKMCLDFNEIDQDNFFRLVIFAFSESFRDTRIKVDKLIIKWLRHYKKQGSFPNSVLAKCAFIESKLDEFLISDKEKRQKEWDKQVEWEKKWDEDVKKNDQEQELGEQLILKLEKEEPVIYNRLMDEAMSVSGKAAKARQINKKYEANEDVLRREKNLDFTTHRIFRAKVNRYYKSKGV
jgi:hypothetical protein